MVTFKQACAFLIVVSGSAYAQDQSPSTPAAPAGKTQEEDLTNLNLDDLANIQVTTASRKAESLFGVAAAISVVTAEDIKRAAANNIPEALRLVPGVNVAQLDAQRYAVSVRGNNGQYASRLLVLIDGRSVYNTLFGGVYWEDNNIAMADIERIEVIRGPGGTLWGANAVNGIINIITKNAKDTQGGHLDVEFGNEVNAGTGSLRYGTKIGKGFVRLTGSGLKRNQTEGFNGGDGNDDWSGGRLSFRYDSEAEAKQRLMVQGSFFRHDYLQTGIYPIGAAPTLTTVTERNPSSGGFLQAKLTTDHADGSSTSLSGFFQNENRYLSPQGRARVSTFDVEAQHALATKGAHSLQFGLGYRTISDDYSSEQNFLRDTKSTFDTVTGFVQDDIRFSPTVKMTLGTKVENNSFTGWEFQPSVRLALTPSEDKAYWLAVSRSVQVPNRIDDNGNLFIQYAPLPGGGFGQVRLFGSSSLATTKVITAEAGHRLKVNDKLTLEGTVFHNSYEDMTVLVPGTPFMQNGSLVIPQFFTRTGSGKTYGFELAAKAHLASNWKLDFGYTYLGNDMPTIDAPKHQVNALSTINLGSKLNFDQAVYFYGDTLNQGLDSYLRVDLQLRYKHNETMEFAFGGRNLGDGVHPQFGAAGIGSSANQIRPELFVRATFKF
jgi:iron complex outermembrane receptor protein